MQRLGIRLVIEAHLISPPFARRLSQCQWHHTQPMSPNISVMLTSHNWDNTATGLRQAQQENRGSITSVQKFPLENCLPSPNVNALKPEFTLIYTSPYRAVNTLPVGYTSQSVNNNFPFSTAVVIMQQLNKNEPSIHKPYLLPVLMIQCNTFRQP